MSHELLPGIVWIDRDVLLAEISSIQSMMIDQDVNEIDVRVQYLNGDHEFHWGDSSYDTDHRGNWAYGCLSNNMSYTDLIELANDLINSVEDDIATNPYQLAEI